MDMVTAPHNRAMKLTSFARSLTSHVSRTNHSIALKMPRLICIVGLTAVIAACASVPLKSGPLIDSFSRATCVPPQPADENGHLVWNHLIETRCPAHIIGVQSSTGHIEVEYPSDPARRFVATFGEKSNPVEVRIDFDACRLYVKASRSPIFIFGDDRPFWWVLEYDLLRRKEVQSVKVEPKSVPACLPT